MKSSGTFFRRLVYGAVIGLVVYAAFALLGDLHGLLEHLERVPLAVVAAACGLAASNYLLRFVKWQLYLRAIDVRIGLLDSFLVFLAGLSMSISPGKVGEVLKSALLKRHHDIDVARTVPVVFAERLTDLLGLFVLAAAGVVVFQYGVVAFFAGVAVVTAGVIGLQFPPLIHTLLDVLERLPLVGKYRQILQRAYESTRNLLGWKILATTTVLSVLGWGLEVAAFAWILQHLGADGSVLFEACFVFSVSTLAGAVSFLPGGLGLTEGSMTGLLMWLDIFEHFDPALAATYLIRFTTLWFGVVVGVGSLLVYGWHRRCLDARDPETQHGDDGVENGC